MDREVSELFYFESLSRIFYFSIKNTYHVFLVDVHISCYSSSQGIMLKVDFSIKNCAVNLISLKLVALVDLI